MPARRRKEGPWGLASSSLLGVAMSRSPTSHDSISPRKPHARGPCITRTGYYPDARAPLGRSAPRRTRDDRNRDSPLIEYFFEVQ